MLCDGSSVAVHYEMQLAVAGRSILSRHDLDQDCDSPQ